MSSSSSYPPESLNGESITTNVIVSDSFEDDEDVGDVIVYTEHRRQDKHSRQLVHQKLEGGIWRWRGVCITGLSDLEEEYALSNLFQIEVKKADDQEIKNVKAEEHKNVKDHQVSEQTINETADTITSLQSEVASLDAKGSLDANERSKKIIHGFII
uniref:Histone-lysine N-methyltransferase family member SUVH9-like n=1 Tax=Tanacetum cinerariifolium TaxID=118510 RepID=A0A699JJT8_TANCI|nr:histone-lysine N-methyltransferase family member SUVH9-like [Tanacetum cinerariifolium]